MLYIYCYIKYTNDLIQAQYLFIYRAMDEHLTLGGTLIDFVTCAKELHDVLKTSEGQKKLQKQYKVFEHFLKLLNNDNYPCVTKTDANKNVIIRLPIFGKFFL